MNRTHSMHHPSTLALRSSSAVSSRPRISCRLTHTQSELSGVRRCQCTMPCTNLCTTVSPRFSLPPGTV